MDALIDINPQDPVQPYDAVIGRCVTDEVDIAADYLARLESIDPRFSDPEWSPSFLVPLGQEPIILLGRDSKSGRTAYLSGELGADEQFVIMETLLQAFEESDADLASDSRWKAVLSQLSNRIDLHAYSVWYWSCLDIDEPEGWLRVTPHL